MPAFNYRLCWLLALLSLGLAIVGSALAAQTIPKPVYQRGKPYQLAEIPSLEGPLVVELLVQGLNTPYSAAWIPLSTVGQRYIAPYTLRASEKGAWLLSEQKGSIWVLYRQALYPLQGLPKDVAQFREAEGYFDLLYHPHLGRVFLSYSRQLSYTLSTVSVLSFQLHYNKHGFTAISIQEVFQAQPPLRRTLHYGGSLAANQEFLYVGLGLALGSGSASSNNPESKAPWDWGKVHKVWLRNTADILGLRIPSNKNSEHLPRSLYSTGHGEIFSLFWDPDRYHLWSVEQSRKANATVLADELNLVQEGQTYDPDTYQETTEGAAPDSSKNKPMPLQEPVLSWQRATNGSAGWNTLFVVPHSGSVFPAWTGNLLITGLESGNLYRMVPLADGTKKIGFQLQLREQLFEGSLGPIRWVGAGPDEGIYLLSYRSKNNLGGNLLHLRPKALQLP